MSIRIDEIPQFVFDELHLLIGEKTKEKLLRFVLTDSANPRASVDTYIRNIMNKTLFDNEKVVDLIDIKNNYHRRRQLAKKNWYKQLKSEMESSKFTPIHTEHEALEKLLEGKNLDEHLKKVFGNIEDQDQYVQSRLKEIEEWANDRDSRVTDFPYLDSKKNYQIERAFENDFVFIICDFFRSQPKNWITHRFKDLIENPVFADGKAKFKGNVLSDQNSKIIYDDYKLSDDRILRSFISLEENEEVHLDKMFLLDEIDSEILEHVMEQRDKRFYTEKKIIFDLRPLILRIYNSSSDKSYELATKRLKKIGRFSLEGRTTGPDKETSTSFLYNLFQAVKVTKDKATGRVFAEMIFSDSLHQQFITKQTVQIYSHFIHQLENRLSKILIYAFQKERLDAYLQDRNMKRSFEYTFFTDRIRFRSKRIESNLKLIESSLMEFKEANILIDDYTRVGSGFDIVLTPLTESEKADFFNPENTTLLK